MNMSGWLEQEAAETSRHLQLILCWVLPGGVLCVVHKSGFVSTGPPHPAARVLTTAGTGQLRIAGRLPTALKRVWSSEQAPDQFPPNSRHENSSRKSLVSNSNKFRKCINPQHAICFHDIAAFQHCARGTYAGAKLNRFASLQKVPFLVRVYIYLQRLLNCEIYLTIFTCPLCVGTFGRYRRPHISQNTASRGDIHWTKTSLAVSEVYASSICMSTWTVITQEFS